MADVNADSPGPLRRVVGAVRLLVGLFLGFSIGVSITDRVMHQALIPDQYFTYFTIQSSLVETVVLIVGGVWALGHVRDTRLLTTVAMVVVPYAIVTALVYNVMLRGIPSDYEGVPWVDNVLHVAVPVYLTLDWFLLTGLVRGRTRLPWASSLLAVAAYPVLWVIYTLIRGAVDGYYPYPFLDPAHHGVGSVVLWIAGLTIFILGLGAACIAMTRVRERRPLPLE
jgi:hypothetical protein